MGDTLHLFYYRTVCDLGNCLTYLTETNRPAGSTSWSSPVQLDSYSDPFHPVSVTGTSNRSINITYPSYGLQFRYGSGGAWSSTQLISGSNVNIFGHSISSVSNDLFVVWSEGSYLNYRQYDAAPLPPTNLRITNTSPSPINIAWDANKEPDISGYEVWRNDVNQETGWQLLATTSSTSYTDNGYDWAYNEGDDLVYWKVRAKDVGGHLSDYSNTVSNQAEPTGPKAVSLHGPKFQTAEIKDFALAQNFPNPFNPSTQIKYTISQPGFVSLKVYDLLGREVVTLVNETKSPGTYNVNWNASQLASGIYFARLDAAGKVAIQKLTYLK